MNIPVGFVDRLGTWALSVVAVIIMPLLPLLVEAVKNDFDIKAENLLLTAAVLAVGFGFSSEGQLYRAAYLLIFFFAVGLDFRIPSDQALQNHSTVIAQISDKKAQSGTWLFAHPGWFVVAVCVLHAIERFNWHVSRDKKFPDWAR